MNMLAGRSIFGGGVDELEFFYGNQTGICICYMAGFWGLRFLCIICHSANFDRLENGCRYSSGYVCAGVWGV